MYFHTLLGSVGVENAADALEYPVRDVLISSQVGVEDPTNTHRVSTSLCHVDRCFNSATEFELVSFDWHDLHERKHLNQLFWSLVVETVLIHVPTRSLQVQALNIGSMLKSLRNIGGVELLRHNRVQR